MAEDRRREAMFSRLAAALSRSGCDDFFDNLVAELADILEVEYVFVAAVNAHGDHAQTLAITGRGVPLQNFSYTLRGTPCETVSERDLCIYPDGVAALFPDDAILPELNVRSYAGIPVLNADGVKLGLLCAMAERPFECRGALREVMLIAAAQVGAELERAQSQRRIRALTYEDPVTGLPNRRQLHDFLGGGAAVPFLLLLDIRRFKDINDLHGNRTGDAVLFAVAARLRSRWGARGLVARCSSNEFALVPTPPFVDEAVALGNEVRAWFQEPVICAGSEFALEVTVGAAEAPLDTQLNGLPRGMELLRQAGVAVAEAKMRNQSFALFTPDMVDRRQLRHTVFTRLLRALRSDELELYFQPQCELDSGALVGAEVLCRWHDSELGWVAPGVFIPLAEERGLMTELGEWVFVRACRQLRHWEEDGLHFAGKLAINVSSRQLDEDGLAHRVQRLLGGVAPSRIVLELTESAMMRTPEISLAQMRLLQDAGFAWAVDDFGVGYSSLTYLTRMGARYIKVDRTFVSRVPGNTHDESVVRTIVAMARSMGMELVAEGIETTQQRDYLQSIGCRYGQGFLLGKPIAADAFAARWLHANER